MTTHTASLLCLKHFPYIAAAFFCSLIKYSGKKATEERKGLLSGWWFRHSSLKGGEQLPHTHNKDTEQWHLSLSLSLEPFNDVGPPTSRVGLLTSINLTWQIPHRKAAGQPNPLPRIPPQVIPDPSKLTTENDVTFSLSFHVIHQRVTRTIITRAGQFFGIGYPGYCRLF